MMILVNTDYISGKKLEMLGLVKGSTIQTKNVGKDIMQSFKNLVGGELTAYNEMQELLPRREWWLKLNKWVLMQ